MTEVLTEDPSEKNSDSDYISKLYERFISHVTNNQRRGQAWMNALGEVNPDLYRSITGTPADCFYDDRKVTEFKRVVFGEGGG